MNKIRRIDSFFEKKRKNIDNSQPSESTPMCNVEVIVEQPQCASVYEKLHLQIGFEKSRLPDNKKKTEKNLIHGNKNKKKSIKGVIVVQSMLLNSHVNLLIIRYIYILFGIFFIATLYMLRSFYICLGVNFFSFIFFSMIKHLGELHSVRFQLVGPFGYHDMD